MILPLDAHAHIEPDIAPGELDALKACVIAVTRSLNEFETVQRRSDASVAWGVGCHPGLVSAIKGFSAARLRAALEFTAVIGEVGLDASSRAPLDRQISVFNDVLGVAAEVPRVVSIHSFRATAEVLDSLREYRPKGVILHWWLGSNDQTAQAVDLGAYFSLNTSQLSKWSPRRLVPQERLLFETDHPFGDRREQEPRRPGNLSRAEEQVAAELSLSVEALRQQTWRNLDGLVTDLGVHDLLPKQFQVQLLANAGPS